MLTIIRDRAQNAIDSGRSLAQLKQSRPVLDYDGLYGATSGPWTSDDFIAAVYQSLGGRL
jgi:hypothetical protein